MRSHHPACDRQFKAVLFAFDLIEHDGDDLRRYRHRGPTLRSLVKWAVKCDSAEQLGEQLRRKYARQRQRAGLATADRHRAEGEFAAELDRLLAQD